MSVCVCSNGNSSQTEDVSVETRLVDDFMQSTEETVRRRNELDCFVARSLFSNALSSCTTGYFTG